MGMFDTIHVRVPLPDGWQPPDGELQTKDFDCELGIVELREDGSLWIDEASLMYSGVDKEDSGRWKHQGELHGWIEFGGLERIKPAVEGDKLFRSDQHVSHDYRAKFTDGKLVEIVVDKRFVIDPPDTGDDKVVSRLAI